MLIALMLGAAALDDAAAQAPIHDGGTCAGLSWVTLAPGERAFVERGPDFNVLRFEGSAGPNDHWWGVYSGNFAQVNGNGPVLLEVDGVVIRRALENGQFRGYLAQKGNWQNHFFGSVFNGTDADKSFFARIDFSARGQALCAKAG
jgi:hypothetical protein